MAIHWDKLGYKKGQNPPYCAIGFSKPETKYQMTIGFWFYGLRIVFDGTIFGAIVKMVHLFRLVSSCLAFLMIALGCLSILTGSKAHLDLDAQEVAVFLIWAVIPNLLYSFVEAVFTLAYKGIK